MRTTAPFWGGGGAFYAYLPYYTVFFIPNTVSGLLCSGESKVFHSDFLEKNGTWKRDGDGGGRVSASLLNGWGAEVFIGAKKRVQYFPGKKYGDLAGTMESTVAPDTQCGRERDRPTVEYRAEKPPCSGFPLWVWWWGRGCREGPSGCRPPPMRLPEAGVPVGVVHGPLAHGPRGAHLPHGVPGRPGHPLEPPFPKEGGGGEGGSWVEPPLPPVPEKGT